MSVVVVLAASACNFSSPGGDAEDAPGLGEPALDSSMPAMPPAGDAPDGDTGPLPGGDADADADGGPSADADGADLPSDQPLPPPSDPSEGDDAGETGSSDTDADEGESGEPQACEFGELEILWAEDAQLSSPMTLVEAGQANDSPSVAVSSQAEAGQITFELDLPCAGKYYVWGLVWDFAPGAWPNPDPDSLYVDAGGEFVWRYGCQTSTVIGGLSWQPLERLDDQPCVTTPIVLQAPQAGTYPFRMRNREAGAGSAVAGIAAIAIGTDPTADPYDAYAPY